MEKDGDTDLSLIMNIFFCYYIWKCKLSKKAPSFTTVEKNMLPIFDGSISINKKLLEYVEDSQSFICREWRTRHGRG